jgi:hypothetical protein
MTKGPDNYDFAGLRINTGPLPAKEVTRPEWDRAQRMKVGGLRDRCRKGKSCSATCIAINKDCVVEMPAPMQRELRRMAIYLLKKNKIKEGSLEDKRIGAGLMQMKPVLKTTENKPETSGRGKDKLKKGRVEFKRDPRRAERQAVSWKEVQGLKARRDKLGNAEFNQEAMKVLQKDAFGRGLRLRQNELEMLFDALPKSTQDSLMSSGKATGAWWGGKDANGNDIITKSPTRARGLAVLDMWYRQGGTDAYQGRGGKVWAPQDLDVEHMRPMSKGGADSPSNWILARAGAQRKRQDAELGKWIDSLPKTEAEHRSYLSNLRTEKTKRKIKKATLQALDPKQFSDKEIFAWGADKSGKAFGARTLFTAEFQPIKNIRDGAGRANSGPPQPFAKAIALIAKTEGVDAAKPVVYQLRDIWNKQLIENKSITPQQAYKQMVDVVQGKLTPEQKDMFLPAVQSWAQSRDIKDYGLI